MYVHVNVFACPNTSKHIARRYTHNFRVRGYACIFFEGGVLQCVAVWYSVVQRVAVCCSVHLSGGELALVARVKTRIGNVHVYVDVCVGVYVHAHAYAFVYVYVYLYVKVYCIRTCIYLCMRVHS